MEKFIAKIGLNHIHLSDIMANTDHTMKALATWINRTGRLKNSLQYCTRGLHPKSQGTRVGVGVHGLFGCKSLGTCAIVSFNRASRNFGFGNLYIKLRADHSACRS